MSGSISWRLRLVAAAAGEALGHTDAASWAARADRDVAGLLARIDEPELRTWFERYAESVSRARG